MYVSFIEHIPIAANLTFLADKEVFAIESNHLMQISFFLFIKVTIISQSKSIGDSDSS